MSMTAAPLEQRATTTAVLADIAAERVRQVARWGDQSSMPDARIDLISGAAVLPDGVPAPVALAAAYPTEVSAARAALDAEASQGCSWLGVIMEEMAEAIEALALAHITGDPSDLRAELVQTAACLVGMVETLDRRGLKNTPQSVPAGGPAELCGYLYDNSGPGPSVVCIRSPHTDDDHCLPDGTRFGPG
jgi:hypothetical protein